jgi:hypothetical protein
VTHGGRLSRPSVVDPDAASLTVLELHEGRFAEVADVSAAQTWTARSPFTVTITPGLLVE